MKRARKIRDVTDCVVETEVASEDQKKGAKKCRRKKSSGSVCIDEFFWFFGKFFMFLQVIGLKIAVRRDDLVKCKFN